MSKFSGEIILQVDTRECALFDALSNAEGITLEKVQLDIGDFQFIIRGYTEADIPFTFGERKEIKDLEASKRDGRYHEQKYRMEIQAKHFRTVPFYVVEGQIPDNCKTTERDLERLSAKFQFRDAMAYFRTADVQGTADLLLNIAKFIRIDHATLLARNGGESSSDYLTAMTTQVKKNKHTTANAFGGMLLTIPGVSASKARQIIAQYQTMRGLIQSLESGPGIKQLADLKCGNRRLGDKLAQKIYNSLFV